MCRLTYVFIRSPTLCMSGGLRMIVYLSVYVYINMCIYIHM